MAVSRNPQRRDPSGVRGSTLSFPPPCGKETPGDQGLQDLEPACQALPVPGRLNLGGCRSVELEIQGAPTPKSRSLPATRAAESVQRSKPRLKTGPWRRDEKKSGSESKGEQVGPSPRQAGAAVVAKGRGWSERGRGLNGAGVA